MRGARSSVGQTLRTDIFAVRADATKHRPLPPHETRPKQEEHVAISPQFSRLSKCNRSLRKAFGECMAVPGMKAFETRVQEYTRFKKELRGFLYVKPQPYSISLTASEVTGPKQFELLLLVYSTDPQAHKKADLYLVGFYSDQ